MKYLQSGLRSRLTETITKHSAQLGRDAVYRKECKISRLPAYLCTQFVRFQYKERASTNAKILKDIKFPLSLDVFELCSPALQDQLLDMRAKFKEQDDLAAESKTDVSGTGDQESGKQQHAFSFPDDVGSNNSGYYQLQAVLTHKGRSSASGHYLSWIRRKASQWFKCDDDEVSLVSEEEILKLSGGGEWESRLLSASQVLNRVIDGQVTGTRRTSCCTDPESWRLGTRDQHPVAPDELRLRLLYPLFPLFIRAACSLPAPTHSN